MNERWDLQPIGMKYKDFLASKAQYGADSGFEPVWMPREAFDFQEHLTGWSLRKGRAGIFADCGLGKTLMELVWAHNVVLTTNRKVLVLTPLAVAAQTVREGQKFGVDTRRSGGKLDDGAHVVVTNYEKLHLFQPSDFAGVVCDESSAIKAFDGQRRAEVTEFMRTVPYRLLATATAAPNDYTELGTSSEALGEMGHMDMLNRFFRNTQNTSDTKGIWRGFGAPHKYQQPQWRFKGHSEVPFWKWVCSWSRAMRKPSDLGFSDERFVLPRLIEREHLVETRTIAPGMLFALPAADMYEEREERRRTIEERCDMAAQLVADTGKPFVIWCHLNDEGDRLSKIIKDSCQVSGKDSDESKEESYEAFATGQIRGLVIKPKIGAWGLNWHHCAHVVTFASHSYEQDYQAVRRCWRFGQKNPVIVDRIYTEGERDVRENLRRKSLAADAMFTALVEHMNDAQRIDATYKHKKKVEAPSWL